MLAAASGETPVIAFESIEGPPDAILNKLANSLSEEANARQIAVVSRGAPANYRVRVYAATVADRQHSELNWVWDVYAPNRQRALRISGEERIKGSGPAAWASADDAVIRKIAHAGMDRLASYLRAPARETAPAHAPPPPAAASTMAMVADR